MLRLLFRIVVWLGLPDISKRWLVTDCTWTKHTCPTVDHFPWKFDEYTITTTYAHGQAFSQLYGRFRAKFQMQEGWRFWLLQLEKHRYLEIDHFEIFDTHVGLCTWNNKNFDSQRRIPWRLETMNPLYLEKIPFMKNNYTRVLYGSPRVREYILAQPRRYDIVWRRWFVLFKVDGWPCGVIFRNIPRQPLFLVVSGPELRDIEEMEVKF